MGIDVELVKAAQTGDKASFAQVYDYYALDLYRVALYTLGNTHDAEDVVSETFLEAYRGIKNLRDPEKVKPWMMRILSIRCKRKIGEYIQGRREMDIEDYTFVLSESGDLSLETVQRLDVVEALNQLTDEERLIISLATIEGHTAKEIAQILEKPQGTVSSKLYRALAKLRELLQMDE